jgi:hypothetical protein
VEATAGETGLAAPDFDTRAEQHPPAPGQVGGHPQVPGRRSQASVDARSPQPAPPVKAAPGEKRLVMP